METVYEHLKDRALSIWKKRENDPQGNSRTVITLSGVPGCGKTTVAKEVAKMLNEWWEQNKDSQESRKGPFAHYVPMDGYHYSRAVLDKMSNPIEAHARRGAPFTFDAQGVVNLVVELVSSGDKIIKAPSFDHRIKDPVPDSIIIYPETEIVLVEGLYLQLNTEPWKRISPLVDDRWFVNVDQETATRRLALRHLRSGIVSTIEEGYERAIKNDAVNGTFILEHSIPADIYVDSIETTTVVED